jgi:cobalt-zinc-cadmium efflux system membrane fusion protein
MKTKHLCPPTRWIFALCACLAACSGAQQIDQELVQPRQFCLDPSFIQRLEFGNTKLEPVSEGIPLTGKVENNPDKVIHFISLVGGVISNTYFSLGDEVQKGQLLAEIRSSELSNLQSERKTLESQITVAERQRIAVQSMYDDGIASQKDLLEAESDVNIKKAELEKVNANLAIFSASAERGVFQIKAPASGIITAKNIIPGMQISAEGEPLFTISDLSEVWVLVNIYAGNVKNVSVGVDVDIRTLSYPGEIFQGKIAALSQVFDTEERVLKARVVMKNPEFKLKPGMFADVMAKKPKGMEAVAVPTKSLIFDDNQNHVVVYRDACDVEIRTVEILSKNNGTTYIARGLTEGEQIVTRNQLLLYEQLKNFNF